MLKVILCLVPLMAFSRNSAFAELIESDESVLDTETGLEWLKFWHGTSVSAAKMLERCAVECFGPGYRYATVEEFETLKDHFSLSRFRIDPADTSWLRTFTYMFGDTLFETSFLGDGGFAAWKALLEPRGGFAAFATGQWYGVTRAPDAPPLPQPQFLQVGPVVVEEHGVGLGESINLAAPDIGHLLVRQTQFTDQQLAVKNGDTNGDGAIDISDVVYSLVFLFKGGERPAGCDEIPSLIDRAMDRVGALQDELFRARARALEMEYARDKCLLTADLKRLPATGASTCVDPSGTAVACWDSGSCPGQDAQSTVGCFEGNRLQVTGDGTLFDECTQLTWQVETVDLNVDGQIDAADQLPWCEALEYCRAHLAPGGWRVPNIKELQSIVDYGRPEIAIDRVFEATPGRYWSSTPRVGVAGGAWAVNFEDGSVATSSAPCFLRVVRGGL